MLTSKGARPEMISPAATSKEQANMGRPLTILLTPGMHDGLAHRARGQPIAAPASEPVRFVARSITDVVRVGA